MSTYGALGTLGVYVPNPTWWMPGATEFIKRVGRASGIVGTPILDWWYRQGEDPEDSDPERLVLDYEEKVRGAVTTWTDRLAHASERHMAVDLTIARATVPRTAVVQVGQWVLDEDRVILPTGADEADRLREWLGVRELGVELVRCV